MENHGEIGRAGRLSNMDRKTARKYIREGKLPSELKKPRTWRTRKDPFEEDWPTIVGMLRDAPELEGKALFEWLCEQKPGSIDNGQLRTFQRKVRRWRSQEGPAKEVIFPQSHRPGEAMQTDFTWLTELEITIAGEALAHMLCHSTLPFSNWRWGTVCYSESLEALKRGVQAAFFRLGHVPEFEQTDNSTSATHRPGKGDAGDNGQGRRFNTGYLRFLEHFGVKPRTIGIGKKEQNGDIEASNGVVKRRLKQHLLLRGSRDFASVQDYEAWLHAVFEKANQRCGKRLEQELAAMKPLKVRRLPEWTEVRVRVTRWSAIRVKHNLYSVPSRLIGETLRVHVYETRLEVFFAGRCELTVERLRGSGGHRMNYRHIIDSLVRKPGAFERYRYREELFPSLVFRRACDALREVKSGRQADIAYLRLLQLAARTMEVEVETAVELLIEEGLPPLPEAVEELLLIERQVEVPSLKPQKPDLSSYDGLLKHGREAA